MISDEGDAHDQVDDGGEGKEGEGELVVEFEGGGDGEEADEALMIARFCQRADRLSW